MTLPWTIPVPVKKSGFFPLLKEHADFNVCVALEQIGAYRTANDVPAEELLHADLQTLPASNPLGRMGAGRAGHYRGAYLKGVGRTPLAANWNSVDDPAHNTGHLAASAAVREYLVSRYFEARGHLDAINGCTGILLAPVSPDIHGYGELAGASSGPLPANLVAQGLSIRGRPIRFSNFLWLSCHLNFRERKQPNGLVSFFTSFVNGLDPTRERTPRDIAPDVVADVMSSAIERLVENFHLYWRCGITFNSVHNNFTIDGRFHDLDNAVFLGGPLLGVLLDQDSAETGLPVAGNMGDFALPFGFDVFDAVRHVRQCLRFLLARLRTIFELDVALEKKELGFLRATIRALESKLDAQHILFSTDLLKEHVLGWFEKELDLSSKQREIARALTDANADFRLNGTPTTARFDVRRFAFPLARQADFRSPKLHLFDVPPPRPEHVEGATFINELVAELDDQSDIDALLSGTEDAAKKIRARFSVIDLA